MENKFLKGEAMETKPTSLKRENHFKGETLKRKNNGNKNFESGAAGRGLRCAEPEGGERTDDEV